MSAGASPPSRGPPPAAFSAAGLQQLRCEHAILTNEKRFLAQAVAAGPTTSARVNSIRYNADAVELKMLKAYLVACEAQDEGSCRMVEAQMRRRVDDTQAKVDKLRQLLESVQRDVEEVLVASGGWGEHSTVKEE
ncbi:hypothetical protein NESM_000101500 [Novymonas esmeraldas]|uniref:Uncharacterized protein n=1 Tax=Novymonas esmeraldas TaxID=1808958 RepID=A0AAW0F2W8_9TRYP